MLHGCMPYHRQKITLCLVLFSLFFMGGCRLVQNPDLGKRFDTEHWAPYASGVWMQWRNSYFLTEFTIRETGAEGEYFVEGTIDGSSGSFKSLSHLVIRDCHFKFYLAKDGVLVTSVSFFPRGTDHRQKLPFKRTFKSVPFDSVIVTGTIAARG